MVAVTPLMVAACTYADDENWPVLPVKPDKTPYIRWRPGASTDPVRVQAWWRQWPDAGIGIVTGAESGLFVLDVDGKVGRTSLARLEKQYGALPKTLTATTPSGGTHYVFSYAGGKTSAGKLGDGLDTRGDGGYFLAAPTVRSDGKAYRWADEGMEPAPAPEWLLRLADAASGPTTADASSGTRRIHTDAATYTEQAFADDLAGVRAADHGTRNHALNIAAYNAGRRIAGGCQDEASARERLTAAAEAVGLVPGETQATISSGIKSGKEKPLRILPAEDVGDDEDREVSKRVRRLWVDERARRQFRTEIVAERNAKSRGSRQMDGAEFVLDVPPTSPVLWGAGEQALWTAGEGLLLVGSDGVGKTTVAQQLALRRLGIESEMLQYPVEPADGRVLYLAMDRPDQARRSFARMLPPDKRGECRDALKERLVVWRGPVPVDVLAAPDALANWIHATFGSDVADVIADSYKDLAPGLSDDGTGAGINSAMQEVLARGLNWLGIHHQRKATGDNKSPTALSDVYGSRWITAGMGSVLMFVGEAGADTVELRHLKQPALTVGPLLVRHVHGSGQTIVVDKTCEPLDVLRAAPEGLTLYDLATAVYGNADAATKKRIERVMYGAEQRGEVTKVAARRGGEGGSRPARYYLPEHAPSSEKKSGEA